MCLCMGGGGGHHLASIPSKAEGGGIGVHISFLFLIVFAKPFFGIPKPLHFQTASNFELSKHVLRTVGLLASHVDRRKID